MCLLRSCWQGTGGHRRSVVAGGCGLAVWPGIFCRCASFVCKEHRKEGNATETRNPLTEVEAVTSCPCTPPATSSWRLPYSPQRCEECQIVDMGSQFNELRTCTSDY